MQRRFIPQQKPAFGGTCWKTLKTQHGTKRHRQKLFPNWYTKLRKSPSIFVHQMSSHPAGQVAWNVDFGGFVVALHVLAQKPGAMGRWGYGDGEKVHGKMT